MLFGKTKPSAIEVQLDWHFSFLCKHTSNARTSEALQAMTTMGTAPSCFCDHHPRYETIETDMYMDEQFTK